MPKKFILVLIIAQSILMFYHWVIYKLLLSYFPQLNSSHNLVLYISLILSLSFLAFSTICHYFENTLLRIGYILSTIWLVFSLYFLLGGAIISILNLVSLVNITILGSISTSIAISLTIYGLINARIIRVTKVRVTLPNLPDYWKNKTAIVAADLHFGQVLKQGTAKKVVKKINSLNPEIVLIPGDFYDGMHNNFEHPANEFKHIKAPSGSFFSSGNHELYAGYKLCEQAIKNAGIKILENKVIELKGLQIIGLAYASETNQSVAIQLEKIKFKKNLPSVLLKHVPNHLNAVEKAGVNLQLSGHTHLGQVWPFRYITKKVFKGFDYGLNKLGNLQVLTSSGVGTWGPPMKVFTKSELVEITFI